MKNIISMPNIATAPYHNHHEQSFQRTRCKQHHRPHRQTDPGLPAKMGKDERGANARPLQYLFGNSLGKNTIPRVFIGRIIAPFMRKGVLGSKPFGKNSPTDKSYIFKGNNVFEEEKSKTIATLKQFFENGPSKITTYPHPFFGRFTPEEWAVFQWKHMDHHLRQFGM